jgi:hypothetical protein
MSSVTPWRSSEYSPVRRIFSIFDNNLPKKMIRGRHKKTSVGDESFSLDEETIKTQIE